MAMRLDTTVMGHPTRPQLNEFAASLVGSRTPVSAILAAHVASCPRCAAEVKHIRTSLAAAACAQLPEPSRELTALILTRARQERLRHEQKPHFPVSHWKRPFQLAACLAGLIALSYLSFGSALLGIDASESGRPTASPIAAGTAVSQGLVEQQAAVVKALSSAVSVQQKMAATPHEKGARRVLDVLDHDLSAAQDALERNPGNPRANQVMTVSVTRQLEELRNLYLDRTL